jgi:hypothetical protein
MQPKEEREKQVLAACAEIKQLVMGSSGGFKSDTITQRIKNLISQLRHAVGKGRAWDEIPILQAWCDKYFSDQKHLKQPGGLPQIQQEILKSLGEIEHHTTEGD